MDIWNVHNPIISEREFIKVDSQIRLWRIDTSTFKVIEQGVYTTILENAGYTLIKKKYASVFQELIGQVEITPVKICDTVSKAENLEYIELKLNNGIDPYTLDLLDSSGQRTWGYNGNLFVSGELKSKLMNLANGELEFYPGFSMFGS